jgi:hypothetical protein
MTDRKTLDQMTSDELDQLYNERDAARRMLDADGLRLVDEMVATVEQHMDRAARAEVTLARVRGFEARLWENIDTRQMPVSAVCHSIANDLRHHLAEPTPGPAPTQAPPPRTCLIARDGGFPCRAYDPCATCDPKEQP